MLPKSQTEITGLARTSQKYISKHLKKYIAKKCVAQITEITGLARIEQKLCFSKIVCVVTQFQLIDLMKVNLPSDIQQ